MSVDALQPSVIELVVAAVAASPAGTVGACVSAGAGQALVEAVMLDLAERLPAASYASTASVYAVPHVSPVNDAVVEVVEPVEVPPR